jgi:hypothetical protein
MFGEWLGRRRHCGTGSDFAAMRSEGDASPGDRADHLSRWRQVRGSAVGEKSSHRHAHKGVQRVPDQVEGWNLVSKEFDHEHHRANRDHGPGFNQVERRREPQGLGAGEQAEGGDGRVNVQPGREAGGRDQGGELVRGEGHLRCTIFNRNFLSELQER